MIFLPIKRKLQNYKVEVGNKSQLLWDLEFRCLKNNCLLKGRRFPEEKESLEKLKIMEKSKTTHTKITR